MGCIFILVQIFICILDVYLIIDFFSSFFKLRSLLDKKYTKAGLMFGTIICVYAVNSLNSATINLISTFMIYLSIIVIFFQGKLLKKFFYYITAMIIILGSEFLVVILLSLQTDFALGTLESDQMIVSITAISTKLLALILFSIAKRIMDRADNHRISLKGTLAYSVMPISLIGVMVVITRLNIDFSRFRYLQILLLICCTLGLIGNVIIFYVFDQYSLSTWQLQQQELMITKLEMEERHYAQVEQINQENAAFFHDIRHYMKTIGEIAAEHDDKVILEILSKLQIKISDRESVMFCTNSLLNAILNEKKKDAERKHIEMKIVVEPGFSIDQITDVDLIVIMGNLLDNAIEATEKCQAGYIKLFLFRQNFNRFSIVKIINNYIGEMISEGDKILTGKSDKLRHGFGLQNVKNIAEKYGGYLQYEYQDGEFISVVILPILAIT